MQGEKNMNVKLMQGDITKFQGDVIVNAANTSLLGGGGVDGAIHRAAGPNLLQECRTLGGCKTGEAKLTKGYNLPVKYIIHTVGPIWRGGRDGEQTQLKNCYTNAAELALQNGLGRIAFPLISAGAYGYPVKEALYMALSTLKNYVGKLDITLVLFNEALYALAESVQQEIR